jgi:hypothetical protein
MKEGYWWPMPLIPALERGVKTRRLRVPGQPELHRETVSKTKTEKGMSQVSRNNILLSKGVMTNVGSLIVLLLKTS